MQWVWDGAWESAFLISFQLMLMLLAPRISNSETH